VAAVPLASRRMAIQDCYTARQALATRNREGPGFVLWRQKKVEAENTYIGCLGSREIRFRTSGAARWFYFIGNLCSTDTDTRIGIGPIQIRGYVIS